MLEAGIEAFKYNFSNNGHRKVILRLVRNRSALEYKTEGPAGQVPSCLGIPTRSASTVATLSQFYGLLYGGTTVSFDRHKDWLINQKNCQKESKTELGSDSQIL